MLDAVVGEGLKAAAEPLGGVARLPVHGLEQDVDLGQVARRRQHEQLLLGREVPVDEGLVDADATGNTVDAGILCPKFVEQSAGRVNDLAFARAATRCAGMGHGHLRTVTDGITYVHMNVNFNHRVVRLHGREVAYVVGGEGPTVLLVHGIGGDWRTWEPVLDGLARRHQVVAVDLPGHGGSAKGAGDYSLGALASALRDLGGALGIERATVIGHSLGGGIAMQFAYQFPERCERLVLVSSGGLGPDVGLILRLATLPGSELFLSLTAPAARSVINCAASAGRALPIRPTADAEHYARAFAALADSETRAAFLGTLRGVVGARGQLVDARDRLYLTEHMPTLIVWGERDAVLPVDHGHAAQQAMPGSRLEIFENAGHLPQLDDPRRFIAVVDDFVDMTEPSTFSTERWTELLRSHGEHIET
jgi:pimeloyl-ACP methyl ester carboxylesterase